VLILGIDTSGSQGTVALLEAPEPRKAGASPRTMGQITLAGGRYSELLLPAITELLRKQGGAPRDALSLIAVAIGPGSFTGLRVAVATVKGLAEVFATPVVAISVLEAVAAGAAASGRVLAVLDAHRNEVFFGEYIVSGEAPAQCLHESIAALDSIAASFAAQPEHPVIVTPDETVAVQLDERNIPAQLLGRPEAADYARIGLLHFRSGLRSDAATLDANYLRRSDAELFSAPKLGIPAGPR
jgi:tRNA threonylcarbamoyladenosine biosynthesis protein TsaB